MNRDERLQAIEAEQTTVALKVLDCVPLTETWDFVQVSRELHRIGQRVNTAVVRGCLAHLRDAGLIREPARGEFQRVPYKRRVDVKPDGHATSAAAVAGTNAAILRAHQEVSSAPPDSPIATAERIARQLREEAGLLQARADDIEALALEYEERVARAASGTEKLRQLRKLLVEE